MYARLRQSVQRFAEGYDLADLSTVSTKALYLEWSNEEDSGEYRVEGGYGRLMDYLVHECQRYGRYCTFWFSRSEVRWETGGVEVTTTGDQQFSAERLIVTVSLAVLPEIDFRPSIPDIMRLPAGSAMVR